MSSKRKWIIEFPFKIIYNFIKKKVDTICEIINNIIKNSDEEINLMIFVGGYSFNEILIIEIENQISKKISHFLKPSKSCLFFSIMEGAVLFGLNPSKIIQRKAKYTFGIDTRSFWNEEIHAKGGVKVYNEVDKKWDCENCFSTFIKVNQNLKLGKEITKNYYMCQSRYSSICFYKTFKPAPIFTYEEGVEKIEEINFDAGKEYPPGQRGLTVTLRIGGTFIDIKAKHEKVEK